MTGTSTYDPKVAKREMRKFIRELANQKLPTVYELARLGEAHAINNAREILDLAVNGLANRGGRLGPGRT